MATIASVTPRELATAWVADLRSGAFRQTTGQLRSGESYCCLGVLIETTLRLCPEVAAEYQDEWTTDEQFDGNAGELPDWLAHQVGLTSDGNILREVVSTYLHDETIVQNVLGDPFTLKDGEDTLADNLITYNDDISLDFRRIAAMIEEQLIPTLEAK